MIQCTSTFRISIFGFKSNSPFCVPCIITVRPGQDTVKPHHHVISRPSHNDNIVEIEQSNNDDGGNTNSYNINYEILN